MKAILYTTLGCHLCEQALQQLLALQKQQETATFDVELVDIADHEQLLAKYAIRIPVIATDWIQDDLGWPFTIDQLEQFLKLPR